MCVLVLQRLLPARHQGDVGRGEGDSLYLFDLDALEGQMASLVAAFPEPHFRHCYAVKAAPMHFVVKAAIDAGLGIEAASLLELENGLRAGCPTGKLGAGGKHSSIIVSICSIHASFWSTWCPQIVWYSIAQPRPTARSSTH